MSIIAILFYIMGIFRMRRTSHESLANDSQTKFITQARKVMSLSVLNLQNTPQM